MALTEEVALSSPTIDPRLFHPIQQFPPGIRKASGLFLA